VTAAAPHCCNHFRIVVTHWCVHVDLDVAIIVFYYKILPRLVACCVTYYNERAATLHISIVFFFVRGCAPI
jgi:hypothetical protein